MDFEENQRLCKKYSDEFERWCQKYGYIGLAKEYYERRFLEGFSEQQTSDMHKLKNLLPYFHPDGYIVNDNNQKITVSRCFIRDHHQWLRTQENLGVICIYGPFGFTAKVSKTITIQQNNTKFVPTNLETFMSLFSIKVEDIQRWSSDSLDQALINSSVEGEVRKDHLSKNNFSLQLVFKNPDIPEGALKKMNINKFQFIKNNISFFLYKVATAKVQTLDDRDDIRNKIVTQKLFFLQPSMSFEKKKEILVGFREKVNNMKDITYVNTSCRNKLDVWSSSRKILLSTNEHMPFKIRTIHPSFKKFLCPFEASDGTNAGLSTSLACLTIVAPGSDYFELPSGYNEQSFQRKVAFIYNGFFMDYINFDSNELENYLRRIQRKDPFASVYIKDNNLCLDNYSGRILRWNGERFISPSMKNLNKDKEKVHSSLYLGFAASLIPLLHHNAGARGVFMANMMKQTLDPDEAFEKSWFYHEDVFIKTITTQALGRTCYGMNMLVQWSTYYGYNIEDGIVISEQCLQKIKLSGRRQYEFRMNIEPGEKLILLTFPEADVNEEVEKDYLERYDEQGVIKVGQTITGGEIIASKLKPKEPFYKKEFLRCVVDAPCVVSRVCKEPELITIYACYNFNLQVGDKLVSNASQKGVISYVAQDDFDLAINPCCIPSRMTLGQVFEGIISNKVVKHKLSCLFFPAFERNLDSFLKYISKIENKEFGSLLDMIPEKGIWKCYNRYYVLGHRVEEKVRAVGESCSISKLTGQPVKGRKQEGGLRFGLMERDALLAYGAESLLSDMIMYHSDGIEIEDNGRKIKTTRAAVNMKLMMQAIGYNVKLN